MKYKKGDKVVISKAGGDCWVYAMDREVGKTATVTEIDEFDETYAITIHGNGEVWWVEEENIELAEEYMVCANCRYSMSDGLCKECCHNYPDRFEAKPYDNGKREMQWVLCSDRMPDKNGDYLITNKFKGEVMIMGYHGGWNRMSDGDARFEVDKDYVVAWMPVPNGLDF